MLTAPVDSGALLHADSGTALAASGDLGHLGPTGTNGGDLVIGLKLQPESAGGASGALHGGPRARML